MTKKREGLKKEKKNSNRIWEIIDDIKYYKTGNILDDPRYEKEFNQFIILRALAMDGDLVELANFINQYVGYIDNRQMYKLLLKLIPITDKKCQWVKNESQSIKDIEFIMEYFKCNRLEANLYYKMNDNKWLEEVKSSFGGLTK